MDNINLDDLYYIEPKDMAACIEVLKKYQGSKKVRFLCDSSLPKEIGGMPIITQRSINIFINTNVVTLAECGLSENMVLKRAS